MGLWYGLLAPRNTPKDVISKLNAAAVEALADPVVRSRLADLGMDVFPCERQTPEALEALVKAGVEKWRTNPYTLTDYKRDQLSALGHRRAAIGLGRYLGLGKQRIERGGPDGAPLQVQVSVSLRIRLSCVASDTQVEAIRSAALALAAPAPSVPLAPVRG